MDIIAEKSSDPIATDHASLNTSVPNTQSAVIPNTPVLLSATSSWETAIAENDMPVDALYNSLDSGPFIVIVTALEDKQISLHPMKLGKILYEKYPESCLQDIKRLGRKQLELTFSTYRAANAFVLSDFGQTYGFKTFIPFRLLYVKGIIKHVDPDITEDDIKHHATTDERYVIQHVHRFMRRSTNDQGQVAYIPTTTCLITFRAQILPRRLKLFYSSSEVEPFHERVRQCNNCGRFGHSTRSCRNPTRCLHCADNHDTNSCSSEILKCLNCNMAHKATYNMCNIYQREIQLLHKVEQLRISRYEALQILMGRSTYAAKATLLRSPNTPAGNQIHNADKPLQPTSPNSRPGPFEIPPFPGLHHTSVTHKRKHILSGQLSPVPASAQSAKPFWHQSSRETQLPYQPILPESHSKPRVRETEQAPVQKKLKATPGPIISLDKRRYDAVLEDLQRLSATTTKKMREFIHVQLTTLQEAMIPQQD